MEKNCENCRFRDSKNKDDKWSRCRKCRCKTFLMNRKYGGIGKPVEPTEWLPMTVAQKLEREMLRTYTGLSGNFDTGYTYTPSEKENEYMKNDVKATKKAYDKMYKPLTSRQKALDRIKKVIFNDPCTIVLWADGTKTVVKCGEDEQFDPEKGLAMAISKYFFNNAGYYYDVFKKWIPGENEVENNDNTDKKSVSVEEIAEAIASFDNAVLVGSSEGIDILQYSDSISVKEYSERYKISASTVYRMIKSGDLHAFKNEKGKWMIPVR